MRDETWEVIGPQCMLCERRLPGQLRICEAFPSAIPLEIWLNIHDHRQPWIDSETGEYGDGGIPLSGPILFKPHPDASPDALEDLSCHFKRPRI